MGAAPGLSAVARAAKVSAAAVSLRAAAARTALSAASAVPGVAAAARVAKAAAGLGGGDGWTRVAAPSDKGTSSGGGLFGAVGEFFSGAVSYASQQVQAVRDHVCGAAEHIADQLGFDLPDLSDVAHGALDVLGFVPGIGTAADIANGILYAAEGNWADAAMSFVSAVPVAGDIFAAGKLGVKVAEGAIGAFIASSRAAELTAFGFAASQRLSVTDMRKMLRSASEKVKREIDRFDAPRHGQGEGAKDHVHFKDGTAMNYDGTPHDEHRGLAQPSKKTSEFLESGGWEGKLKK